MTDMNETDSLQSFARKHRDLLLQNLKEISAEETGERNRFLCISIGQNGYVQCRFFDEEKIFLCEAESGFYRRIFDEHDTFQLNDEQLRIIKELGFSAKTPGNFRKQIKFVDSNDYLTVADLILATLYKIYGARFDSHLEWDAPTSR